MFQEDFEGFEDPPLSGDHRDYRLQVGLRRRHILPMPNKAITQSISVTVPVKLFHLTIDVASAMIQGSKPFIGALSPDDGRAFP